MNHPKAVYKMTKDGMEEKTSMSLEETHKLTKEGWSLHPEEARLLYRPAEEKPAKKIVDMTKAELEEHARQFGIELDRRKSKVNMLKDLEELLK